MNKTRIVVVGGSQTNMGIQLAHLPAPGETELGGAFDMAAGGKGANQAVAAARAGSMVTFVACVGCDIFGDQALAELKTDKIDTDHVARHATARSGVALSYIDRTSGESCTAVATGGEWRVEHRRRREGGEGDRQCAYGFTATRNPVGGD